MKEHKRLLSLLLATITLTAMFVFAGGNVNAASATVSDEAEFMAAIEDDSIDTITIDGNFDLNNEFTINRIITMNGTGKITFKSDNLAIGSSGNLTITDHISIEAHDRIIRIYGGGAFTLSQNASLTSDSTVIDCDSEYGSNITVNGGSVTSRNGDGIHVLMRSKVLVTGGTINAAGNGIWLEDGGVGTITGGTIHGGDMYYSSGGVFVYHKSKVNIGGTADISGPNAIMVIDGGVSITSSSELKLTGDVSTIVPFTTEKHVFFNELQKPLSVKKGISNSFSIKGVDSVLKYELVNPSDDLNLAINSNIVKLIPNKAGTDNIKLECKYADSTLSLTIPVTVSANGSSTGEPRPSIPETGALPVLPMLAFFGFAALAAVGAFGYKAYAKRSR